jgi:hypothetical protein
MVGMKTKKALGGTKARHKVEAESYMLSVRRHADKALAELERGRCTSAYLDIVEMWKDYGSSHANQFVASLGVWEPTTQIREVGYQFSTRCLRDKAE